MSHDHLKRAAATAAIPFLYERCVLGIGTGSTVQAFIEILPTAGFRCASIVSSSLQTTRLLHGLGIETTDPNRIDRIDLYVDGADAVTPTLCLTKGGGAALTGEKILAGMAHRFICIVDETKCVLQLGEYPIPIEVIPSAMSYVTYEVSKLGGNGMWRKGVVTDNGHHIVDLHGLAIPDPALLENQLNQIAGVVTVGIFAKRPADILLVATEEGVKQVTAQLQ